MLEVAAYQLLFLDRIPAHAAIHEAVESVRELLPPAQARGLAAVVNATLRSLAAAVAGSPRPGGGPPAWQAGLRADEASVQELALATSHPAWLVARWVERFGAHPARAILEADNRPPGVHLRPHAGRITAGELVERLAAEGAESTLHTIHPRCVVLAGGDPTALASYREGLFAIQDVSAQIVSALIPQALPTAAAGLVVDLCAAPGGKIGAAAERPAGRTFLALDISRARLARVAANARRQGLPLLLMVGDARSVALARRPDFIVADVPCLGTGTFRRRVDARWRKSPGQLPELVALQRRILENAADLLAPGGRLLYATCSLESEENQEVVERLLESRSDLSLVDLAPRLPTELRTRIGGRPQSALFITPAAGDCDGAFAALLERVQ